MNNHLRIYSLGYMIGVVMGIIITLNWHWGWYIGLGILAGIIGIVITTASTNTIKLKVLDLPFEYKDDRLIDFTETDTHTKHRRG